MVSITAFTTDWSISTRWKITRDFQIFVCLIVCLRRRRRSATKVVMYRSTVHVHWNESMQWHFRIISSWMWKCFWESTSVYDSCRRGRGLQCLGCVICQELDDKWLVADAATAFIFSPVALSSKQNIMLNLLRGFTNNEKRSFHQVVVSCRSNGCHTAFEWPVFICRNYFARRNTQYDL